MRPADGDGMRRTPAGRPAFLLLMQEQEAEFFAARLRLGAPDAEFLHVAGRQALEEAARIVSPASRLIAFCSPIVVPPFVLDSLAGGCFNFHPGPPERRGYRPAAFAALENAGDFGVTLHLMAEEVDSGPIVDVMRFAIEPGSDEEVISIAAYRHLLAMVDRHAAMLADVGNLPALSNERWTGARKTRRELFEAG